MDPGQVKPVDANEREEGDLGHRQEEDEDQGWDRPRDLPADLPRSLDDRRRDTTFDYGGETEYYDGWQGQSQFLSAPSLGRTNFNLALHDRDDDDARTSQELAENDARLTQMLAAQARMNDDQNGAEAAEEGVIEDQDLSKQEKKQMLQDFLFMAASNGDADRIERLVTGKAAALIDVNAVDSEGTPPLVYASCFGHREVVEALLNVGAVIDKQDKNQWTALMWAMTNRHKDIARVLLDHGASTEVTSSTGRTALDFVPPDSEMSEYLHNAGYRIGNAGVSDDFYNAGLAQDRFEEELAENEMKRRMMMESARDLEVDLGNLGLDETPESPDDLVGAPEFIWDRCLNDQMFVFQENDLNRILNIIITDMTPQRSPSQKPVPANIIFLGARYAHYHANRDLLSQWLSAAQEKIYSVVDRHQWDMTMLAFWISNATLLLYYLKKDAGLMEVTSQFQAQMSEQIHEIYILILRDAERRMDKVLDAAVLDHETIPGFEDIHFQNEWSFLRKKAKVETPEPLEKRIRPQSPRRRAQISPRNITSLLSSTLFVLDLYDIHSVIITQTLSQLFYWLSAEIFNRIMSNKRFMARTKAMQIRMNISTLEDWARNNNRQPEHYEGGSMTSSGETTVESARRHLAPVVQLLQWLQCFSSLGQDHDALDMTLQQLPQLTSRQLLHAVKHYRAEVGEKTLSKATLKHVQEKQKQLTEERRQAAAAARSVPPTPTSTTNGAAPSNGARPTSPAAPQQKQSPSLEDEMEPDGTLLNAGTLLPFQLPTSTDMLVSYGAGFGGVNKERARRYVPTIPPDFFTKLDPSGRSGSKADIYQGAELEDDGKEENEHEQ
ncbi:hypothetical protein K461DRAFT_236284 [Myriangium duriaei CBS 260.36]|uniref:Dilute domain-containing protein n=1 Tax=Myriangium duriaei CBS 260.36 TaxID=1168546 RepID=A0A9P4J9K8_9PEZI|nr:hypothetical protein K461DRAFT_236284 [Myriangium duriaei CBS 260.36]